MVSGCSPTPPRPAPPRPAPPSPAAPAQLAFAGRPRQCHEELCDVLDDLDLASLARIEHQVLELLQWSVPMGPLYQAYADAIFEAASCQLGRQVAAPQVLLVLEEHTAHAPTAAHAAVQKCAAVEPHSCRRDDGTTCGESPCVTTQLNLS